MSKADPSDDPREVPPGRPGPPRRPHSVARDRIFAALDEHRRRTGGLLKLATLMHRTAYSKPTCIKFRREWLGRPHGRG